MYEYRTVIERVVDGDTVVANVDLGFSIHVTMRLRLAGIDTPELVGSDRPAAEVARDALKQAIEGKTVRIVTRKDKADKYGRIVADLYFFDGEPVHINTWMVNQGYAKAWP